MLAAYVDGSVKRWSTILVGIENSQLFEWIPAKFCTDIHAPQMMNLNDFDDPMTFPSNITMRLILKCLNKYWMDSGDI